MNLNEGDHVVYVPKQNNGDNVHHGAVVRGKTPRGMYQLTLDTWQENHVLNAEINRWPNRRV